MTTLLDAEMWAAIRRQVIDGSLDDDGVITHIVDNPCKGCARYTIDNEPKLAERIEEHYNAPTREDKVDIVIDAAESYKEAH